MKYDETIQSWLRYEAKLWADPSAPIDAKKLLEAADTIDRLIEEGRLRMGWIMGLVNHAKELGARYAADWPEPLPSGMESGDEPRRRNP